ncbi:MAG: DUF1893 domain-containing protein [Clostridiales bacterium]|nr:DUF1893 domain-containing protein [Clostridiales bacterium]
MINLPKLANRLKTENLTLIASKGQEIIISKEKGIARVLSLLNKAPDLLYGALVVDKIVGKAAALLFIKAGIAGLYALTLSKPALECLNEHGIPLQYETLVPHIKNRTGSDICPMEKAVMTISDPDTAYTALRTAVNAIKKQ